MERTKTISLGLLAAWACHDLEELFTMRATSRVVVSRMPSWAPIPEDVRQDGLSQQHVQLAMTLMGTYVAAVSAVGARSRGRSHLFRGVLLAFGLHGFGHIGSPAKAFPTATVPRRWPPRASSSSPPSMW